MYNKKTKTRKIMFKFGDKIICIDDKSTVPRSHKIIKGEIYTFKSYSVSQNKIISLYGYDSVYDFYDECRFLSLKVYRKQKLNKICSKSETTYF